MKITPIILAASAIALASGCTSARQQMGYARAVSLNELPAAAQTTVHNEVGDRPIKRITEETKYGKPTYRVEVEQPWINSVLWVNRTGAIVNESKRLVVQRDYSRVNEASGAQSQGVQPQKETDSSGSK